MSSTSWVISELWEATDSGFVATESIFGLRWIKKMAFQSGYNLSVKINFCNIF